MRYCKALNGALNIERDRIQFCCATKNFMPMIPWNPDEELPMEKLSIVRKALIENLSKDLDAPVPEYVQYGLPGDHGGHPCKGCRHIIETDAEVASPEGGKLTNFLHLQAFTYCNAKCVYCELRLDEGRTPLSRGHDLDLAINKSVRQLIEAGAIAPSCQIMFSSGEPSLSKSFMETLQLVVRKGFRVFVNTNAICFAPEIEEALKTGKALVQVSLDSSDPETYLSIKGVDKFENVVENVKRYQQAAVNGSIFWVKYIVFSKTNEKSKLDNFVDFCVANNIRNVSVNANYNEGDSTVKPGGMCSREDDIDYVSLKAFAYLAVSLEIAGINVHKEYVHLTQKEQEVLKAEYALAVAEKMRIEPTKKNLLNIVEGMELASSPPGNDRVAKHIRRLLNSISATSSRVALYGAGGHAQWIKSMMEEEGLLPVVVLDRNANKQPFPDVLVVKPESVGNYDVETVIIGSNAFHLNILAQLKEQSQFSGIRIVDPYLQT